MRRSRLGLEAASALIACGPVLASLARIAPGWVPAGDVAILTVRSQDVLSRHVPLLGMPSTASEGGAQVFHPGPLQLWVTGLARAAWDAPATPLVVGAAVGIGSVMVAVHLVRVLLGPTAMALAAAAIALLGWSLRGEVLASPFNPYVALLPFGAYLVAVVAATEGGRGATVAALTLGSWAAQAHLAFAGPVVATAGCAVAVAGRRGGWRRLWSRRTWPAWALLLVAWSGPLADVFSADGGNVRALLAREGGETLGLGRSVEVVVQALGPRPVVAQAGAGPFTLLASPALVSWVVALFAVAGLVTVTVRGRRRTAKTAAAVVLAGLAATTLLLGQLPDLTYNALALHSYLPLWPLVLAAWAVVLGELVRGARRRWPGPPAGTTVVTATGLVLGLVLAVVSGLDLHRPTARAERERADQVSELVIAGLDRPERIAVHVDASFEPFAIQTALIARLDRFGVEVRVPAELAAGFGDHRVADGSEPIIWVAVDHPDAGEGGDVIARTSFRREDGTVARVVVALRARAAPEGDGTLTAR